MTHCLLTFDRGDRAPLYNHCLWQVSRFTTQLEHVKIVHAPKSLSPDLKDRVKEGFDYAVQKGIDWVVIIESDDYYSADYLENILPYTHNMDFIGCEFSYYFNLKNRTWDKLEHRGRSSLYTTAFRVSAMKGFPWHRAHDVFLDQSIWNYANRFRRTFIDAGAIGIKHGIGLTGGKGHRMVFKNRDPDLTWLESKVDKESFQFYKSLQL